MAASAEGEPPFKAQPIPSAAAESVIDAAAEVDGPTARDAPREIVAPEA